MTRLTRYTVLFLFYFSWHFSSTAQIPDKQPHDSLYTQELSTYRQQIRDILPKPENGVCDYEHLFTATEIFKLNSILIEFEKQTAIEIVIITVDTMFVARQNFEDFTLRIATRWEIGKKEADKGILIAISRGYRRMRIENGYGIEQLITDIETKQLIDSYFIPDFKNGEYFKGTESGVRELTRILKTRIK